MAQTDPTPSDPIGNHSEPKSGGPGALSRWMQRNANARTNRKIRRGRCPAEMPYQSQLTNSKATIASKRGTKWPPPSPESPSTRASPIASTR